jgi:hypothetical protein
VEKLKFQEIYEMRTSRKNIAGRGWLTKDFYLINLITKVMAASSSGPAYLNKMRCLSISAKYSFASLAVLVPNPAQF